MAEPVVHVVGAGLAGLSTALHLASRGTAVVLHEAAGHAGGRCRSFDDARLGRRIDNGNHLVLSGNRSTLAYLALAGAPGGLRPGGAAFPFVDLADGGRWTVRMNRGPLPLWILSPRRRIPGTGWRGYVAGLGLALAGPERTVAEALPGRGLVWRRFWEPLTLAVLNRAPEQASARLLWQVFRETLARGERFSRPMFAPDGLGAALVAPALGRLAALGCPVRYRRRLRALERADGRVAALCFEGERLALGARDRVVLALPPSRLGALMPELDLPADRSAIVNAHFVVGDAPHLAAAPPMTGVLGGLAQWVFVRGDVVSVTVSAAERLLAARVDREALLDALWRDAAAVLGLAGARPAAGRLVVEKRATFEQSPAGAAKRPPARTAWANLVLAGDATATGLPATIEGAVRSGETAARLVA